jgi:hypothetical protein
MGFWQPFLKPQQTRIIYEALTQMTPKPQDEKEREELREWFEAEVEANAQARGELTGV